MPYARLANGDDNKIMYLSESQRIKLANDIRDRRIYCKLSLEDLAHFSHISHTDMKKIENGELVPDTDSIKRIYITLGAPLKIDATI